MALIDLSKKVQVVLDKRNMAKPPVTRVGLAVDGSGSMRKLYQNGTVQRAVDRVLGVSSKFDDDGNLDMWFFDDGFERLPQATPALYGGYVKRHILDHKDIERGTEYLPFMTDAAEFYFGFKEPAPAKRPGLLGSVLGGLGFGRKPEAAPPRPAPEMQAQGLPALMLPITDGVNTDRDAVGDFLDSMPDLPIYWQFCGIGNEDFDFLRRIADWYPNVGFCRVPDLQTVSDDAFYETLLSQELIEWVRRFGPAA